MAKCGEFNVNALSIKNSNSVNIKLNENLKNIFEKEDSKSIKEKVSKSIEFAYVILPKWFVDNGISIEEDMMYDHLLELLDKVKNASPEMLLWKNL